MAFQCSIGLDKECDGCMSCKSAKDYYCPVCGNEVYETVYVSNDGDVLGCENCAQIKEPWEMLEDD